MRRPGYLAGHQTFGKTPLKQWAAALKSRDANKIADQYTSNAILLATLDDEILVGRSEIKKYFVKLVKKPGLHCVFDEMKKIRPGVWAGKYTFKWQGGNLPSRFTFIIGPDGIQHHHSSSLPKT